MLQEFPVHDEYHCANDVKVNAKARLNLFFAGLLFTLHGCLINDGTTVAAIPRLHRSRQ